MAGFVPRGRAELRRLLDVADLDHAVPSTLWDREDSGTWRTGLAGDDQPAWQAAAHHAGSVTAWRTFTSEDGHALEVQVIPLASSADAPAALASVSDPARWLRRGGPSAATVRGEPMESVAEVDVVPPLEIVGADNVSATSVTSAPAGRQLTAFPLTERTLRATAGQFLVVAVAVGQDWEWADLASVVAAQVEKLH